MMKWMGTMKMLETMVMLGPNLPVRASASPSAMQLHTKTDRHANRTWQHPGENNKQ